MNKIGYYKWVKALAAVFCMIFVNLTLLSFAAIACCGEAGIYAKSRETVRQEWFDRICMKYSLTAIADYQNDFSIKKLGKTNFRYAVKKGDTLGELDYGSFDAWHFDKKVTKDMLYIYSFSVGKNTEFAIGESLFDSFCMHSGRTTDMKKTEIDTVYFARDMGRFYCKAGDKLYEADDYDLIEDYRAVDTISDNYEENGRMKYVWDDAQAKIHVMGQTYFASEIPIMTKKELAEIGTVVSMDENYEDYFIQDGYVTCYLTEDEEEEKYFVLSYVNEPLEENGGFWEQNLFGKIELWKEQDFFVQAEAVLDFAYAVRYVSFAVFAVSFILAAVCFFVLMCQAGHHGNAEIVPRWIDKIPYDILIVLLSVPLGIIAGIADEWIRYISTEPAVLFGIFFAGISEILLLVFCMSTSVRLKQGGLLKHTVCFSALKWTGKTVKKSAEQIGRAVPMLWKAWTALALLAVIEFAGLASTFYEPGAQMFLWFVEKVLLYGFVTICLFQMKKLQQTAERLARGGVKGHLDTSRMFWDFKRHGENLNHIQEGISRAVEEQMKSERFKTELITNVSHDIKTPLTSIINYIDLLEKEKIESPNAKEYLEVLSRQSARLKKLIEDLMEASKASTGNLSVVCEPCDIQVMLTQTVGEFEEKLKEAQIELIVKGSAEQFLLRADPKHLWRVFENLMNNICKYAQPSTRAYVNIEKTERSGRIIFRNVSKYELNIDSSELAERFVRGDSSRNTEGSGLGLSIAQSLTELMQGTFELVVDGDLFKVILTFPAAGQ